jgi:hypothetical protein
MRTYTRFSLVRQPHLVLCGKQSREFTSTLKVLTLLTGLACLVHPVQGWRWVGHRGGHDSRTCGQIVGFRLVRATTGAVISDLKNGTVRVFERYQSQPDGSGCSGSHQGSDFQGANGMEPLLEIPHRNGGTVHALWWNVVCSVQGIGRRRAARFQRPCWGARASRARRFSLPLNAESVPHHVRHPFPGPTACLLLHRSVLPWLPQSILRPM